MYNHAWVTSANGDLNFDGDLYDATAYHNDYKFTSSSAYLATDARPGGDFEWWPATHSTTHDEGHFYMECSNRGLCDRKTGLCKCFEGYEGGACKRRVCPNDCSGHGVCRSVSQLLAEHNTVNSDSRVYTLWDKDMARTCKCDPGFTGPDCSEKYCPFGDDPLTTDYQIDEVQYVEVRSEQSTITQPLGGTATFSYKDHYGETWTTDPITIQHYDGSTSADQMATDLEAALESIPNDVFKDVTVTAGFCETVLPNKFINYGDSTSDQYNGGTNPTGFLRCPAAAATYSQKFLVVDASDASVKINGFSGTSGGPYEGTAVGGTAETDGTSSLRTCNLITYPECVRFKIEFSVNPGNLEQITADVSSVTINQKTNAQDATGQITTSSVDQLLLVTDQYATFGYTLTSTVVVSSSDDQGTITTSTNTITFGTASSTLFTFPVGVKIDLYCTTSSVKAYLGRYTTSTTTTAAADIIVVEKIIAPNGDCAIAGAGTVEVRLVTHYIDTNVDFSEENIVGYAINFNTFIGASQFANAKVASTSYPAAGVGYIFFEGTTDYTSSQASAADVDLILYGVGSKENVECGDRGLCDRETGDCKCFIGYTGDSCSIQHSLAV